MTPFRRIASVFALATVSAVSLPGCIIGDCEDGQENCISLESGTFYTDTDTQTVAYAPGQALIINGFNGSIEIEDGAPDNQVVIETQKRALGESSDAGEEAAKEKLDNEITIAVTTDGNLNIVTDRTSNDGNLAVNMVVRLPSGFNGAISIEQGNGSVDLDLRDFTEESVTVRNTGAGNVDITGADGALNVLGGFDIAVQMDSWGDGNILCDGQLGDISVTVPANANGRIAAQAGDDESLTAPATWETTGGGSFTLGDGSGGTLTITGPRLVTLQ